MSEIQTLTLSLLLFIACRIANPANERDMEALNSYRDYIDKMIKGFEGEVDE